MPTISIFIRDKDLPRWQALTNKSQWLHDNLPLIDPIDTDSALTSALPQKKDPGGRVDALASLSPKGTPHPTTKAPEQDENYEAPWWE